MSQPFLLPHPELPPVDLFVGADSDEYRQFRIPGLVKTPAGTLLAHTEARRPRRADGATLHGDYMDTDLMLRRSVDGGKTWEKPILAVDHRSLGGGTIHNFCPIPDRVLGCVHALFCHDYARAFYIRSDDDGLTWSHPRDICDAPAVWRGDYAWNSVATGVGHGIQLLNGRLLAAVWVSSAPIHQHEPNRCGVLYSDDHGATWQAGHLLADSVPCLNEAQVVECANGEVLINMRNRHPDHRRALARSPGGIAPWSEPVLHPDLPEPVCMGAMIRLRHGAASTAAGDLLLFSNPDSLDEPKGPHGFYPRRNLTLRLSLDGGNTWPAAFRVAEGPAGYSDLLELDDGTILCLYEHGGPWNGLENATLRLVSLHVQPSENLPNTLLD